VTVQAVSGWDRMAATQFRPEAVTAAPELLAELSTWATWQLASGLSPRTIDERRKAVLLLSKRCDPLTATAQDVVQFMASGQWAAPTRQNRFSSIRTWFRHLRITGKRLDNPCDLIPAPRVPRANARPVTNEEIARLLGSGIRTKTRMMVLLAMYEGLRVHEVAKFRGQDIRGDVLTVTGKGGVRAALPLHPEVARYASWFPAIFPAKGYWFPGSWEGHASPKAVSNILSDAFKRAGVDATAHQLRHWYGTKVLRAAGGNLRVAQELLRHSSPAITARYTEVDDTERRSASVALPTLTAITRHAG